MEKRLSAPIAVRRTRLVRTQSSLKRRIKTAIALTLLALLSVFASAAIYLIIIFVQESRTLPPLSEIGNYHPTEPTRIYTSDNKLLAELAFENRQPVTLKEIDPKLVNATIAIEDSRFYEHRGVDYHGIARAVFRNVIGGDLRGQGASTITQQLARNINELGLTKKKKLTRKVREAILAVKIEQTFTKDEILERYLNQVYYGAGAYGIEPAAQTYFHKSAKKLTLGEAAFLAGLPQRPVYFSSPAHRDAAFHRRESVLQRMVETGRATAADAEIAKAEKLTIYKPTYNGTRILGSPYVVNWVIRQLVSDQNGESGYGTEAVYSGWKIFLTIDSRIQDAAETTLREAIRNSDQANQGALICLDPRTGYVRAMVGGIDYSRDQFDVITQGKRQPGSAFKPIVYTAGLDTETCTLDKAYTDDPYFDGWNDRREKWLPKNYGKKYTHGPMRVLTAIKTSTNTIAVKVAVDTGLKTVIDYAHRMGITTEILPYPPIALGAAAVRPIELCSAYAIFANGGKRPVPNVISRIVAPDGDTIDDRPPQLAETGLKPETIESMNTALLEVVLHGTGTRAAAVPNAHGKTGTTSDARDAWFAGYTPELVTVIWVAHENRDKKGRLDRKEPYKEMEGATGGHLCAPIWRDFMLKAVPIQLAYIKATQPPQAIPPGPIVPPGQTKKPADLKAAVQKPATPLANPNAGDPIQEATSPDNPVTGGPGAPPITSTPPSAASPVENGSRPTSHSSGAPTRAGGGRIDSGAGPRMSEPSGRLAAPTMPRQDPGDEIVNVRLCADSMRVATQWCDQTVERRMRRRDTPGRCRTHRAPPGETDR